MINWFLGIVAGVALTLGATSVMQTRDDLRGWNRPVGLTTAERRADRVSGARPIGLDVLVRFESPEQIAREVGSDAYAYTRVNARPCEVVFPDTWEIDAVPSSGDAWFSQIYGRQNASIVVDMTINSVVAHEILHCLRGSWHK